MTYTVTGPFTNGGAPGVSATFLNNVETWIESLDAPTSVVIAGGTSGTATLYEPIRGTYKKLVIVLNNFRTAASNQDIALPLAFTTTAMITTGLIGLNTVIAGVSFVLSGSVQNMNVLTGVNNTPGGSSTVGTSIYGQSFAYMNTGFDTVRFLSGSGGASNGLILVEGV